MFKVTNIFHFFFLVSFKDNGVAVAPATFVQQMLDLINKYRIMHAAGPLEISQELTKQATSKAVEMAALDKEQIDVNSKFGEAIFSTMTPNNIPSKSVQSWYNQMRLYDFHRAIPSTKSMYFTQMIWASTKEFGAGKAVTPKGKIYVVALFNPPGNKGSFENEVRPVTGELQTHEWTFLWLIKSNLIFEKHFKSQKIKITNYTQ